MKCSMRAASLGRSSARAFRRTILSRTWSGSSPPLKRMASRCSSRLTISIPPMQAGSSTDHSKPTKQSIACLLEAGSSRSTGSRVLVLQLRKRGIGRVILGGMLANMCVESHLRELLEQGFEVAIAKDATAAPKHPEWGYGYTAALINYAFLAHAVLTTDETVEAMQRGS